MALCSTVVFEILGIQKGLEAYPCRFSVVPYGPNKDAFDYS